MANLSINNCWKTPLICLYRAIAATPTPKSLFLRNGELYQTGVTMNNHSYNYAHIISVKVFLHIFLHVLTLLM